jgi:DNA-binding transcriptional MerR regulator
MVAICTPVSRTELARLANVTTECLRKWAVAGIVPSGVRVSGKRTEFTPADALVVLAVAKARGH